LKICIVTLADDRMREMGDLTAHNKKIYAERHRYDMQYYPRTINPCFAGDGPGNSSWNKILAIQEQLPNYDWVFWSDADALIMNQEKGLEEILRPSRADFIIGRDKQPLINCGQFFIRNCNWSYEFLNRICGLRDVGKDPAYGWWEQGAVKYLLRLSEHLSHCDYRPMREFNSYADFMRRLEDLAWMMPDLYQPGDFICHFSGISFRENENNYYAVIEEMKRMLSL
jgi:galactosyl transferase GMA12/MNN10 family